MPPSYCRFCCLPIADPHMVMGRITSGELADHVAAGDWPLGMFHVACWHTYLIPGMPPAETKLRTAAGYPAYPA